jgi:hypothetical protein
MMGAEIITLTVFLNIDTSLLQGIFYGFFEITIGIKEVSNSSSDLLAQLLAIEALLAWNGLAIQAQVTGMILVTSLPSLNRIIVGMLNIPNFSAVSLFSSTLSLAICIRCP